jgi:hypothetical protein
MMNTNTPDNTNNGLHSGIDVSVLNREVVVWVPLVHPEVRQNYYDISNHGIIRRRQDKFMMSNATEVNRDYQSIKLARENTERDRKIKLQIHRLVASAFLRNPNNKKTVDHVNRNRADNHVSNLRWATHSEQNQNQEDRDRSNLADRIPVEALDPQTREVAHRFESMTHAAKSMNSTKSKISAACRNPNRQTSGFYWRKATPPRVILEAAPAPANDTEAPNESGNNTRSEPMEEWRFITTRSGDTITTHQISNRGVIRSVDRPDLNRVGYNDKGTMRFDFYPNGRKRSCAIHELVAATFIGVPPDPTVEVWHKNRNRKDNRVENLEWVSRRNARSRLTYRNARGVRVTWSDGRTEVFNSIGAASTATGVGNATISVICNGQRGQRTDIRFEFVE